MCRIFGWKSLKVVFVTLYNIKPTAIRQSPAFDTRFIPAKLRVYRIRPGSRLPTPRNLGIHRPLPDPAIPPCQCFTLSLATATSPAWSLMDGFPSSWCHPSPAVTRMIWNPPLCLYQLLRTPGSKLAFDTVMGTPDRSPAYSCS